MKPIFEEGKNTINGEKSFKFQSPTGFHLIIISARVKGEKQISPVATDDEDLIVEIDNKTFPKLNQPNRKIDSPAAFSGGKQQNLSKTIYYLTYLQKDDHSIVLKTGKLGTANLEKLEVYKIDLKPEFEWELNNTAEDGDRRAWITFVLYNLPIQEFSITITYSRRKGDSDDVKVKIDGQVQNNLIKDFKHYLWYFAGSWIPFISTTKTETQTFTVSLPIGLHYLELDADRMPTLERMHFYFGSLPTPKRIPTVDDPKWTEDFNNDSEAILLARVIFGEGENQPQAAKVGIGFTVINRIKKQRSNWGLNIRDVITGTDHYNAMWDRDTKDKVRDPLGKAGEDRVKAWYDSYHAARGVLDGSLTDPTFGATNFHSFPDPQMFPSWATQKNFKIKIGKIYFYELES